MARIPIEIARGDVIAEIEIDRATVEMEATASWTLDGIVHDAGAVIETVITFERTVLVYSRASRPGG